MRVLFIGDVVGKPGRAIIRQKLSALKHQYNVDIIVANGENVAGGNGITPETADELFSAGIDILTMGNHVWDKKEAFDLLNTEERIVRPANYPSGVPGSGGRVFSFGRYTLGVINLSGRVFMGEQLDCPFRRGLEELNRMEGTKAVLVDFHAEATSEKMAMGWFFDGKVSAVVGTHTHIQTADERILPGGTAYITDAGMTGPRDSVLGVKKEIILHRFQTQLPARFELAGGPVELRGVVIDIDHSTGRSTHIERVCVTME